MNIGGASVTYYMCQISACQVLQVMHRWIEWISTVYTKSQNFWVINTVWNSGPLPKWRKHHDNRNNEDKSFDSPIQNQNCQCCAQQRLHYPSLLHALVPCQSVVWPHEYSSMLLCTCSCRFIWNLSVFGFSSRRMDGWGLLRMSVGGSNRVILIKNLYAKGEIYTKGQNFSIINATWNSGPTSEWKKHYYNRNNKDKSFGSLI